MDGHELARNRPAQTVRVWLVWKRIFLLACFIQLGAELCSNYMFLWPLDHSCARQIRNGNLTKNSYYELDNDDAQKQLNQTNDPSMEAMQTVFGQPNLDSLDTAAQAFALGIKHDDIARCYQNKYDNASAGQMVVDVDNLVPCQYGYHIEAQRQPLSVIGHFQLICTRQQLKVLLPLSLGFGFMLGLVISYCLWLRFARGQQLVTEPGDDILVNQLTCDNDSAIGQLVHRRQQMIEQQRSWGSWLLIQIVALLIVVTCDLRLSYPSKDDIKTTTDLGSRFSDTNFARLLACVLFRSLVVASCLAKILTHWQLSEVTEKTPEAQYKAKADQLAEDRLYYKWFVIILVTFHALFYPLAARMFAHWTQLNNLLTLTTSLLVIGVAVLEFVAARRKRPKEIIGEVSLSLQTGDRNERGRCIDDDNEDEVNETASRHDEQLHQADTVTKVCEFCLINEPQASSRGVDLGAAYQPTTTLFTTSAFVASGLSGKGMRHNLGAFDRDLGLWPVLVQIWLLAFCLVFNYFLFNMIPDHKLLHAETIEAMLERKRLSFGLDPVFTLEHSNRSVVDQHLMLNNETTTTSGHLMLNRSSSFNWTSVDYSSMTAEAMRTSANPFAIFWATANLNSWPLELLVVLLHLTALSNFFSTYFKLNRLLSLVKFGSNLLIVLWISIAILRGRNHLIETDWLRSLVHLVSRFISALMVHNFLSVLLKLSHRLNTNKLVKFEAIALVSTVAFIIASMAPILEKLDLVIIPIALFGNNYLALHLAKSLGKKFKQSLCPMIFDE